VGVTSLLKLSLARVGATKAIASDRRKEASAKLIMDPASSSSADFLKMINADLDRWQKIAKALKYQPVDV
jgi:tripartite-type tricarboxylate transporter receptor subunit TctC